MKRPAEHIENPRPRPLLPLDQYRLAGVDERRVLRWLLAESIKRLREGRRLERDRRLVYPECSVIARDIARLTARLNALVLDREINLSELTELVNEKEENE